MVAGCKHCVGKGECTYCHPFGHSDFDASCKLNCPAEIPLLDEMPNKGGKKCVQTCESERAVESLTE